MDLALSHKRALVIGASRGLGNAIARSLLAEGVTVYAGVRNVDALLSTINELPESQRGQLIPLQLDLASLDSIESALAEIEKSGGVDVLIGNCGGPPPATASQSKHSDWLSHFEMMAANLFLITQRCLPHMQRNQWGRVVYITSSGVEQPIAHLALSNGIRSAVVGWAKSLSLEVAKDGISVNCVLPGRIHTQRVDQLDAAAAERQGKTVEQISCASKATIPAGRYGKPSEFADVVTFLCSQQAAYITGSKVRVDGGSIKSI